MVTLLYDFKGLQFGICTQPQGRRYTVMWQCFKCEDLHDVPTTFPTREEASEAAEELARLHVCGAARSSAPSTDPSLSLGQA